LDGEKDSLWTFYNNKEQRISEIYYNNNDKLKYITYEYWENGNMKLMKSYKKIKLDGPYTSWYENGYKKEEGNYWNGKRDSKWLGYWEDGTTKEETEYLNGVYDGLNRSWYQNGNIKLLINYESNVKEGVYQKYFSNGQKIIEGSYKHGLKHGSWSEWDKFGSIIYEDTYDLGVSRNEENASAKADIISMASEYLKKQNKWLKDEYWIKENFFNDQLSLEQLRLEYRKMVEQRDIQISLEYKKLNNNAMNFMRLAVLLGAGGYGMSVTADGTYKEYKKAQLESSAQELYDKTTMQDNISIGMYAASGGILALAVYYESQRVLLKRVMEKENIIKNKAVRK